MYVPALIAAAIILFTLIVLDHFEKNLFPPERIKSIHFYFNSSAVDIKKIKRLLARYRINIQAVDIVQAIDKEKVQVSMLVRIPMNLSVNSFYKEVRALPNINKIEMDEGI